MRRQAPDGDHPARSGRPCRSNRPSPATRIAGDHAWPCQPIRKGWTRTYSRKAIVYRLMAANPRGSCGHHPKETPRWAGRRGANPLRQGLRRAEELLLLPRLFFLFLLRGRLALRLHFGIGLGAALGLGIGFGLRLVRLATLLRGRLAGVLRHHQRHCNGGSGQDRNGQQLLHEVLLAVWLGCFDPTGVAGIQIPAAAILPPLRRRD
ncbi:hypothetical protein Smlt1710 [Stenotrophomonas maltophilia K279a]|uniref:Transmembrane protein n=1 Tax=Stenotrophomonas maltophilia (strain K279a) TaxID=522373 RepID=B2FK83_STRMK|nr:hypothetical protein Smlt1710 [Stenotrophomonas maltophilia K279a]